MTLEQEAREDVRRLLALTWRPWAGAALDAGQVTRSWSLDLGWLSPEEADAVLARLLDSGWIISRGDALLPAVDLAGVVVPLGWFPRQNLLSQPPTAPADEADPAKSATTEASGVKEVVDSTETLSAEGVSESIEWEDVTPGESIPELLESISSGCGLERQEVMRRAQRKLRTLGDVTLWMALALVARDQGLNLSEMFHESS